MTGDILRLGPFTGGLNLASDPTILENEELIECLNMELDIDGSLVYRLPIQVAVTGATNKRFLIFGSVIFSGILYLFGTQDGKTFVSSDEGVTWTELNPGAVSRECVCMVVYQKTVWMPATPGSANGGIKWTPAGGAVAVAAMPRGTDAVVHKNRLYVCPGRTASTNESRLHFSEAANFDTWPGTDFVDVNPGDGTSLNAVIVYQDNLLLFKDESTFYLAYDLDPADAILREVNSVLGVKDQFAVIQHENTVYTIYHGDVYEIVNLDWNLINLKVPFVFDDTLPPSTTARFEDQHISLLGDRLVARFFNRTYIFSLRTRTWSEWRKTESDSNIEWHIFGPLIRAHADPHERDDTYFTAYSFDTTNGYKIFKIHDMHTAADTEGFGNNPSLLVKGSGNSSTPDHASLDIIGDIDLEVEIRLDDWTPFSIETFLTKWDAAGNQRSYWFGINASGTLLVQWSTNGTNEISKSSSTSPVIPANGRLALRVTIDVDNGAAGNDVKFYTAPDINGTWTQLGTTVTTAGVTSIHSGTAPLRIGDTMNGNIFAARVLQGIAGTVVANPDFSAQAVGITSFVDAAGKTWTINSPAKIAGKHRFHCIITTKDYDMADPVRYKRLFWWGCDALTGNDITADVQPISLAFQPTWDDLGSNTWNDLNIWNALLSEPSVTQTVIPGDGNFLIGKAFKFLKSLRFRKVNFSVLMLSDGTSLEAAKLFSILGIVKTKQVITQKVS